jgi:hypothetical protein
MAWNEFSPAEESQVAKIARQDSADRFFSPADGIIHREFLREGTTVNGHYYLEVIEHLQARVSRVRNEQFGNNSWLLLHV